MEHKVGFRRVPQCDVEDEGTSCGCPDSPPNGHSENVGLQPLVACRKWQRDSSRKMCVRVWMWFSTGVHPEGFHSSLSNNRPQHFVPATAEGTLRTHARNTTRLGTHRLLRIWASTGNCPGQNVMRHAAVRCVSASASAVATAIASSSTLSSTSLKQTCSPNPVSSCESWLAAARLSPDNLLHGRSRSQAHQVQQTSSPD